MTRTKMRKELLLGTVALMAGIGLASAQGLREGGSVGGSEREASSESSLRPPGSAPRSGGAKRAAKAQPITRQAAKAIAR